MLTRVIVALIAIPILILIIFLTPLWALGALVGVIAAGSTWEFLRCTEKDLPARMRVVASVCAFFIPFCSAFYPSGRVCEIAVFLLFAYMFCELMLSFRRETTMDFESVAVVLMGGAVMPVLITSIVRLGARENGSVYAFLPFVAAFSCDAGAYFAGMAFGRHKMTPRLSPHKTIEGSVGGFLSAIVLMLVYGLILRALKFEVNLAVMAAYGLLGSVACELGDLSFSAVKRLCGIKDYGTLIPGHGGMLDRFDSMFWTAALLELLVSWVPAITK